MSTSLSQQEWSSQYAILKRAIAQKRQSGVSYPQSEIGELSDRAEYLAKVLNTMAVSPMEFEISQSEIARRQVVMDNLRKQIPMIAVTGRKLFGGGASNSNSAASSARNSLASEPRNSQSGGNSNRNSDITMSPMMSSSSDSSTLTNKGLVQRHKETIQLQDEMIEDISRGVDVLHSQALEIGHETKIQTRLLDEMDTNVDKAALGLGEEAKHADNVRETSNACAMYICIALEVVAIIILLIIVFGGIGK